MPADRTQAYEAIQRRWSLLQQNFSPPSLASHTRLLSELLAFIGRFGDPRATPQVVTPDDVVNFFIEKDLRGKGQTKIHADKCPLWGDRRSANACPCPVRMAVASVRSQKASLQGAFRNIGFREPWHNTRGAGNPCNAQTVDLYIATLEREQCAAGVETVQAALIDESVYNRLLQAALSDWQAAPAASLARVAAVRNAFMYSLLWNSGMRCGDALHLHSSAVTTFASALNPSTGLSSAGLYIDVTTSKTISRSVQAHRVTVWDDSNPLGTSVLWRLYQHELLSTGLPNSALTGPVFRRPTLDPHGVPLLVTKCTWHVINTLFEAHLSLAGLDKPELRRHISLHSFHGSRAARERRLGIPPGVTCRAMAWSLTMYNYYTDGREPLTIDGIAIMSAPPVSEPPPLA